MKYLFALHRSVSMAAALAGCLLASCGATTDYPILDVARVVLLVMLVVSTTISDLSSTRIPNQLSYVTLWCAGMLMACAAIAPTGSQISSLAPVDALSGALLCGGLAFVGWHCRAIGGGDVKLAAALGALLGLSNALSSFLWAHLLAAACVGSLMLAQRIGARPQIAHDQCGQPMAVESAAKLAFSSRTPMAGYYAGGVGVTLLANCAF